MCDGASAVEQPGLRQDERAEAECGDGGAAVMSGSQSLEYRLGNGAVGEVTPGTMTRSAVRSQDSV